MPIWSNTVPENPRGPALPIRRTPASGTLKACVTSEDLVGCYTHYYQGRTQPCEAVDCEACHVGVPYRWHAYMSAVESRSWLHFIFEVTACGAEPFITYREAYGTLRGCVFDAHRWRARPNGRILVQTHPLDLENHRLPHAPDLTQCLAILWNLNGRLPENPRINPEKRTKEITPDVRP